MPRCFALTKIGQENPTDLLEVDREICAILGQPVDDVHWCKFAPTLPGFFNWYDVMGLRFAMGCPLKGTDEKGQSLDSLIAKEEELVTEEDRILVANIRKIINYLRENYTVSAWWQSK
jgi:DNA-binding XRE family transcriptional regulator